MARARNIKPGFFTNDQLGELPPLARLLFAGIWTVCDREGRIEDRHKKIKAEVLPYDDCNVDKLLQSLHDSGFILRYVVNGVRIIQVLKWHKHQAPHIKEAASALPSPDESDVSTVPAPDKNGAVTGKESLIVGSGLLVVDSLNLNPDSRERRATRLPSTWTLPDEWVAEALTLRPDWTAPHCRRIADAFRDYWCAQPGQRGVRTDWIATWRNWVRREHGHNNGPPRESAKHAEQRRIMDSIRSGNGSDNGTTIDGTAERVA